MNYPFSKKKNSSELVQIEELELPQFPSFLVMRNCSMTAVAGMAIKVVGVILV